MAAPSRSSPNQPVQKHSGAASEAAIPAASADPVKPPPPEVPSEQASRKDPPPKEPVQTTVYPVPSYSSTESSDAYQRAKQLLAEGNFDEALATTEEAITTTLSLLPDSTESGLHESLAPLHYLYGTTLLYSVEESPDNPETNLVVDSSGANGASEESAGDIEIAWENLESARHIVQGLVANKPTDKLKLDLAQIHLRLGDLQRTDGRYLEAISDYTSCLELREAILGDYNRGVADSRYMLALVYMMLASEGDRQQEKKNQGDQAESAAPTVPPELIEEYRSKSIVHYLSSARSIAGTIALECGADPGTITAEAAEDGNGGKTTGLDPSELSFHSCSRNLRAIRNRVASLNSQNETVKTLAEMLDEIQEIVDEAENTKRGLHDMSKMTAKVHAEIAAADKCEESTDGATTTMGFGAAGAAAAATATAAPMMVVKKKKKRDAEDSKMPAQDDTKRSKTE